MGCCVKWVERVEIGKKSGRKQVHLNNYHHIPGTWVGMEWELWEQLNPKDFYTVVRDFDNQEFCDHFTEQGKGICHNFVSLFNPMSSEDRFEVVEEVQATVGLIGLGWWVGSEMADSHGFLHAGECCPWVGLQGDEALRSPPDFECSEFEDSQ